jgi:hypothetical protein
VVAVGEDALLAVGDSLPPPKLSLSAILALVLTVYSWSSIERLVEDLSCDRDALRSG